MGGIPLPNQDCGTVFKITPSGTFTTVYGFCSLSNCDDGRSTGGPLVQGTDGNFYGQTVFAGPNGYGTLFRVTPKGVLSTLVALDSSNGGGFLGDGLVQGTNGIFYGPTFSGGISAPECGNDSDSPCGTIFRLSVGLGPFVETLPTSGKVGSAVKILGSNLTGATGASFNGTAAVFKVVSKTLISATVPTGATTGFVTVTLPSGKLKSNVKFRVQP